MEPSSAPLAGAPVLSDGVSCCLPQQTTAALGLNSRHRLCQICTHQAGRLNGWQGLCTNEPLVRHGAHSMELSSTATPHLECVRRGGGSSSWRSGALQQPGQLLPLRGAVLDAALHQQPGQLSLAVSLAAAA